MAGKSFQFTLTTPQGKLVDVPATAAVIPAHDGSMGILPGRAPMVVKLGTGPLRVDIADTTAGPGGSRKFVIDQGFAHMVGAKLTILTAKAIAAETLTESDASKELAEAQDRKATTSAETMKREHDKNLARVKLRAARSAKAGI